jgi:hypothetical protein
LNFITIPKIDFLKVKQISPWNQSFDIRGNVTQLENVKLDYEIS